MQQDSRASAMQRGKLGEKLAKEFLIGKKYEILATGWRSRFGEIDIVAKDNEYIVFVEVKLRKNANFAHGREYVGKSKQSKIRATANHYLMHRRSELQPRFDVIEIYMENESSIPNIIHLENAF